MTNTNEMSKDKALEKDSPEQRGKKAIEAGKKIHDKEKSDQQKKDDEKKDAEQWRNEG